jgi:hypothetical protein
MCAAGHEGKPARRGDDALVSHERRRVEVFGALLTGAQMVLAPGTARWWHYWWQSERNRAASRRLRGKPPSR